MTSHYSTEFTHYFWPPNMEVSKFYGIVEEATLSAREVREVIGTIGTIKLINNEPEGIAKIELLSKIEGSRLRILDPMKILVNAFYSSFFWNTDRRQKWLGLHEATAHHMPTYNPIGQNDRSPTAYIRVDHRDIGRELFRIHIPNR